MTDRVLGIIEAAAGGGTTLVGVGGIHGNEPAGVRALETVLAELGRPGGGLSRGRFIALAGNRPALDAGVRYIDRDLNRIWNARGSRDDVEGAERGELLALLDGYRRGSAGPPHLVDLHTTSGSAPPFVVVAAGRRSRDFARALPAPLVLALSSQIPGTLVEYLAGEGWTSIGFESGSHRGIVSVEFAVAALWIALEAAGLLGPGDARSAEARDRLAAASRGLPGAVEVFHHHPVAGNGVFRMHPGYRSFQGVDAGEALATEGEAEIRSPSGGQLLMPLYQRAGREGFFLAHPVHRSD